MLTGNNVSPFEIKEVNNMSYFDRDALFSYDKVSEAFLQRVMSLMVASHYKVIIV